MHHSGDPSKNTLSWDDHIRHRRAKAANLFQVLVGLGKTNGGMSPKALTSLYTGTLSTTFTWGAELFNRLEVTSKLEPMRRLEYQALRMITRGYHGSSLEKLGEIANIDPLQDKLDDISRS